MAVFSYLNENNPHLIGDGDAQEMINCRIDKGYIEFYRYDVDEETPIPSRTLNLPNGRTMAITANNNMLWNGYGKVRWRKKGSSDTWTQPGVSYNAEESPLVEVATVEDPENYFVPKAEGTYFYAVTLRDTVTGEESSPVFKSVLITNADVTNQSVIRFTFSVVQRIKNSRYTIAVYRMPFGGSEYLESFTQTADIDEYVQKVDSTKEEYLGKMCNTEELTNIPYTMDANCIAMYADKFWIGGKSTNDDGVDFGIVYFSRTGSWAEFPASFFFTFPDPVVGLTKSNEMLVVQTEKQVFIIYGDSEDNFVQKEIEYKFNGIVTNSGQSISNMAYFIALKDITKPDIATGIFSFNGSTVSNITQRICKEFDTVTNFKNWATENRFYVFELKNSEGHKFRMILDTIGSGFCKADSTMDTFRYRTKEFSTIPNGKGYIKKMFVRMKGSLNIYIIGDSRKQICKIRLYSDSVEDIYFYVNPRRFSTYSVIFEGYDGTEVYDWGVKE